MVDFRIEKLANNLLTYSVNIQKEDNILIEVLGEDGINLAKELIKKAGIDFSMKAYLSILIIAPLVIGTIIYVLTGKAVFSVLVGCFGLLMPRGIITIITYD